MTIVRPNLHYPISNLFTPAVPVCVVQFWSHENNSEEVRSRRRDQYFPVSAIECRRLNRAMLAVTPVKSFT